MKFSIRRDLGLQLLTLYLLFVGRVVVASISFDRLASQRLETDVKAADLALARAISQETNTALDSALQAVTDLARYPEVIDADADGMEALFSTLMSARPDVNLVYRLDSNGIMLFHHPIGPGSTINVDFSFRDYFQRALTTHEPILSLGRISPTTEQPVTTAVMPLWNTKDQFLGLVATNIRLQSLSTTLSSISAEYRPEEAFDIAIVDAAGRVIAHPNPDFLLNELAESLPEVINPVLEGQSGTLIAPDNRGEERLYSYVPIPSAGWGVMISRPTATAFATPRAFHQGVLLAIIIFLIVGLTFWIALSRQVIQPLENLAVFSQTIGLKDEITAQQRDNLAALSDRSDQIGHLIRSLQRMEEVIKARLRELSTLLQTSAAVVSSLDSAVVLNNILEQVEHLMGIHMCAIVAMDQKRGVFRAQASRGLSQHYVEHIAINPSEPLSVSMRAVRSGEPIQVSDTEKDSSFAAMRPRSRAEGYRSVLCVPLHTQHAPPSVLLVYRPDPHKFSEREINLLCSFANHAAMAIENAALYTRSDMRLREQTRRLEALIQSLNDGLILEDLSGKVLYANRRISELVELPLAEIVDFPLDHFIERLLSHTEHITPEQRQTVRNEVQAALQGRGPRQVELAIETPRNPRYLRLQVFDVTGSTGAPIGRGQILRDITQNKEIDRMKSSLISTVSHELRTPLAAIKGYATTLLADDVEWDSLTQREFLSIISQETDRLSNLVNDLLDMSRIEAGNLDVTRVECRLEDLIANAAECAHPPPIEPIVVNLPPDLPPLCVDRQRIEVVLRNLIENATKYAGNGSPIHISAVTQRDQLIVRVEDKGPGIPPEHSQSIFDSFFQIQSGLNRENTGAGLGLAICHGFVKAHGGKIWVEPRPIGTCIAFSLPIAIMSESPPPPASTQGKLIS